MSTLNKGSIAAIIGALTYIFGFILFFVVLDPTGYETPEQYLAFMLEHRDTFFAGYIVIGIIFSFALIMLVQAIYQRFKPFAPELMGFTAIVGYLWAFMVLSSTFIFLTSLETIEKYYAVDPEQALLINHTVSIVVDALGGGIELIGAIWVLLVSVVGLKNKIYNRVLHYSGLFVGIAGVLTLFSGLSFLSSNTFFQLTTAIFGLGQIFWFLLLGIFMFRDLPYTSNDKAVAN